MTSFFLSYRTDDSVHATMVISERLALHFGRSAVFRDQDSLAPGMIYPRKIREAVTRSAQLLAIIGPHWLSAGDGRGRRRIDDPRDWVRTELRLAFEHNVPVIPVLLDETPLPRQKQLPHDIRLLSLSNYWRIRHQTFASDVDGLVQRLHPALTAGTGPVLDGEFEPAGGIAYAGSGRSQTIYLSETDAGAR
jgi:hypothetical protein